MPFILISELSFPTNQESTSIRRNAYPEQVPTPPIFDGFTDQVRQHCIGYLSWHSKENTLAKPTPSENHVLQLLGYHVASIIKRLVTQWLDQILGIIRDMPFARKLADSKDAWNQICEYASLFKRQWEEEFGLMDDDHTLPDSTPYPNKTPITIRSTGSAAKMFLCLMLVNRALALDARRTFQRNETCFSEVAVEDLAEDDRACPICREPLGIPNADGEVEMPIRVVACCGNYFGLNCLRTWYSETEVPMCPLCKCKASSLFLEKLFAGDEDSAMEDADELQTRLGRSCPLQARHGDEDLEDGEIEEEMLSRERMG